MGKIGDLWVRLGLKSDDYKKGMKDAQKETTSFSDKLGKMKAAALAVWAAVGAGAIKLAKEFISATNAMSDAWEQSMSKMKASFNSLMGQITANVKKDKGWWLRLFTPNSAEGQQLGANAKIAGEAAKEMTKAFDAEFELVNSVRLQRAQIQEELNELYIAMRNTTLSPADRKAAADRYRSLLQPLVDAEIAVYSNMLDKASAAWQAGTGLSREYSTAEISEFFANYGTNPAAMTAKYGELAGVYENQKNDTQNQVIYDILTKLEQKNAEMSDVNKVLSRTELAIDKALVDFDARLAQDLESGLQEVESVLNDEDFFDLEIEFEDIDLSKFDEAIEKLKEKGAEWVEAKKQIDAEIAAQNEMLAATIADSLGGATQAFTDMLFNLEGADAKNILAALLQPFAQTAGQLGTMLITQGLAIDAFKESLKSLQGGVAIAAGAALLAVSAAMKSGIQALAGGQASASTATTYSGNESAGTMGFDTYDSTITVEVVGKLSGSDILLAGSNQQKKWNR